MICRTTLQSFVFLPHYFVSMFHVPRKGPEGLSEVDKLQLENKFLKNKISILEKYNELERMWRHNYL